MIDIENYTTEKVVESNMESLSTWIIEADISSMQAAMNAGELTAEELVNVYLENVSVRLIRSFVPF